MQFSYSPKLKLTSLIAAIFLVAASHAYAGITVSWTRADGHLIGNFSGAFSEQELNAASSLTAVTYPDARAAIYASSAFSNIPNNNTDANQYVFESEDITLGPGTQNYTYSSGNTASGDVFSFVISSGDLYLYLASGYVANSPVAGTLSIADAYTWLEFGEIFTFGDFITLNGSGALVTYVDGTAVPEPSVYAAVFGALALGFAIRRRRL